MKTSYLAANSKEDRNEWEILVTEDISKTTILLWCNFSEYWIFLSRPFEFNALDIMWKYSSYYTQYCESNSHFWIL